MRNAQTILRSILRGRGISGEENITEYLSDHPVRTYDPFLMKNMKEAVELILKAAGEGRSICIYGDYDADGVTSICTLYRGLSCLTDRLSYYIPSRFREGYGLNDGALEQIARQGTDLVITVDCGITSVAEAAYAKSLGMDIIVTDHHSPGEEIPDCIVIDPKQPGETYPFPHLAGCGVAFKLLQALQRSTDRIPRSCVGEALDLVGAGTVGDIVSLTDENRTIVKYGMQRLNQKSRPAMRSLTDAISLNRITSENIAFGIIPHINAAGRMGDAKDAVKLFLAEDPETIRQQTQQLVRYNAQRRQIQEKAYQTCEEMLQGDEEFIILKVDGIHEGIAGIAAGKLKESRKRPVILATPTADGKVKGTGRSIPGVDIREMLAAHGELFLKFGGHSSACGFTMEEACFDSLKEALREDMHRLVTEQPQLLEQDAQYEMELQPAEVTIALADALEQMEPFGEGNRSPSFLLKGMYLSRPFFMGAEQTHVRFDAVRDGAAVPCVLFRRAQEFRDALEAGVRADLIGSVKTNEWNGTRRLQFIVEEIELGNESESAV